MNETQLAVLVVGGAMLILTLLWIGFLIGWGKAKGLL